jgi:SAM-dependent methyltransferase
VTHDLTFLTYSSQWASWFGSLSSQCVRKKPLSNEPATNAAPIYKLRPDFAKIQRRLSETRTPERLVAHYALERKLSDRLRRASREARRTVYTEVYSELVASLPDHPYHCASRASAVERLDAQLKRIGSYLLPGSAFLEIGCGDAALAFAAAPRTSIAYAVDVTDALIDFANAPVNFRFLQTNGVEIPLATASIDLAYSNQLMEHLHTADAADQLEEVHRILKPGGCYICITPSRLTGPHDISCYFDYEATCFHLREYDYGALRDLFQDAGFTEFRCYVSARGKQIRIPYPLMRTFELIFLALPRQLRVSLTRTRAVSYAMGLNVVGVK